VASPALLTGTYGSPLICFGKHELLAHEGGTKQRSTGPVFGHWLVQRGTVAGIRQSIARAAYQQT